ncbi:RNA degradosome polyphosphate kinase [Brevibacillus dissolubilis]|uniref:RNA degradosome polyphosphate kinase n=1 Tax=Brevibacillus dissolubilis TaxID=1844116 RepID=UPI00111608F2|nr:RNA degradosome polyphosphate kinase [Brevibacillus dissolubilis]
MEERDLLHPDYFINREMSWLAFNARVLEEALDKSNPVLERLKFLAIVASNLDEFFMVRVAGLKDQVKAGFNKADSSGKTPKEQLRMINQRTHQMVERQYRCFREEILPALADNGIEIVHGEQLSREQEDFLDHYFDHHIYPVLTPLAVDQSRPFPLLLNKSLNLAIMLERKKAKYSKKVFAVVQVPAVLSRYIELPGATEERKEFILLEDVIKRYSYRLFKGNEVSAVHPFRITRNADMSLDEEGAEDLLKEIEKELKKRKWGAAVRLEIDARMDEDLRHILQEALEVHTRDIYSIDGPLDLTKFMSFTQLPGYEHLRDEVLLPQPPADLVGEEDIFEAIAERDILMHHPYESFEPVVDFVTKAAQDPNVLAIKQTLYRVSGHSPIVRALANAAENGKQVTVLVELKARFDEENNIHWARQLEKSGCQVIYGLVGLKTHCKIVLVVRKEGDYIRRYVHLGTGNYNNSTARLYTDIGLFTSKEEFGMDASALFNDLSGYSEPPEWNKLEAAPKGLRRKFSAMIRREIEKHTPERPGRIIAKMNSLTDEKIIGTLYEASCAGVQIDLIIRGICCLRPGIPGVSENIRVFSIIDRFLEHSRIYYFGNGGDEEVYLSSADWMTRNLDRRVELMFPVEEPELCNRVTSILEVYLSDNTKARALDSEGTYHRVRPADDEQPFNAQRYFMELAVVAAEQKKLEKFTAPYKPAEEWVL